MSSANGSATQSRPRTTSPTAPSTGSSPGSTNSPQSNRLDLDGANGADLDLLVGLRLGPVTNIVNGVTVVTTNVVTETFSDERKALTGSFGPGDSGYITLAEKQ